MYVLALPNAPTLPGVAVDCFAGTHLPHRGRWSISNINPKSSSHPPQRGGRPGASFQAHPL